MTVANNLTGSEVKPRLLLINIGDGFKKEQKFTTDTVKAIVSIGSECRYVSNELAVCRL